ncbi:MAG: SUMF1/EgtB/PvdO family nonheme iron enzyme [Nannocystaceae bacterium]
MPPVSSVESTSRTWTDERRHVLVAQIAKGQLTVAEAAQQHELEPREIEAWADDFITEMWSTVDDDLRRLLKSRGLLRAEHARTEFRGRVDDVAPPELIQLLVLNKRTGTVVLDNELGRHYLWVRDGSIIHAESAALEGEAAVLQILAQTSGTFIAHFRSIGPIHRTVDEQTQALLMKGVYRADESQRMLRELPLRNEVLAGQLQTPSHAIPTEQQEVLDQFGSGRSIDDVLRDSHFGHLETISAISELHRRGYLVETGQQAARVRSTGVGTARATRSVVRQLVGGEQTGTMRRPSSRRMTVLAAFAIGLVGSAAFASAWRARTGPELWSSNSTGPAIHAASASGEPAAASADRAATGAYGAREANVGPSQPPLCSIEMAFLEGARFRLGSDADDMALATARPSHEVELPDFCLDRRETTLAEFDSCVATGACGALASGAQGSSTSGRHATADKQLCNRAGRGRAQHPINCVTWTQADAYCHWHGKRLPSEAEWEYAAKGTDDRPFPWGEATPEPTRVNACDQTCAVGRRASGGEPGATLFPQNDAWPGTSPVGSFPSGATPEGLFDMAGNVFEWTSDYEYRYGAGPVRRSPRGPIEGSRRIARGGAFDSATAELLVPSYRQAFDEWKPAPNIGFRCASDAGSDHLQLRKFDEAPPPSG